MKKVLGIPVKDMTLGSTRTRYFYMLKNLPSDWTFERYTPGAAGDVLYIQKTETPDVWEAVKDCKARNIPIVYERDDFCKPWNDEHTKIMDAADAVTIITKGLLKHVTGHTTTPLYFVPDGFDYDITRSERVPLRSKILKVITYGRHANMEETGAYYKHIDAKKYYICDRKIKEMKDATYIEWKMKSFKKKISKCDLVVIAHARNFRERYKDPGRAMVSMAMGIPVVATANIEVTRIMKEVGHPELIMKRPDDIKRILKTLRSVKARKDVSNDLYNYAWENYRPDVASKIMADIFEKVIYESTIS